jgi:hypothetical protein
LLINLDIADKILKFEALSISHQKIIICLLISIQNILERESQYSPDNSDIVATAISLLNRCTHQKNEDSKLEQRYLNFHLLLDLSFIF